MGTINLTPERFVQMIVLGLFWEHPEVVKYKTPKGYDAFRMPFTTVDHILKIFRELGVITQDHISKGVQHRRDGVVHQRRLLRHTGFISRGSSTAISNAQSYILVRDNNAATSGTVDLIKLVTNKQIEITEIGKESAPSFEPHFEPFGATKETYLAKAQEINEQFENDRQSAAASNRYRERLRHIQSEEEP